MAFVYVLSLGRRTHRETESGAHF